VTGEQTIRITIWLAMGLYALSTIRRSRCLYTAGLAAYLAHVAAVFHFAHGWSHSAAYEYTAQRTAEVTGNAVGAGLFVNYAFTAMWIADAVWWWTNRRTYEGRSRWFDLLVHAIFVFMIFNSTVIFASGPVQWYGATICALVAVGLVRSWVRSLT